MSLTTKQFLLQLSELQSRTELEKVQRFFRYEGAESKFLGIGMAKLFAQAKQFIDMPLSEVKILLESEYYEARLGAVSIMDFKARDKKTSNELKRELFELYISMHGQINNWDLVDRSAPYVVGGYLYNKPRSILYELAKSDNVWERRTAIVATYFFIRKNDIDETFRIAEILLHDEYDLIQTAVGSWIREAGKRNKQKLLNFLDKYAPSMPRLMLRYAIKQLDKEQREKYLNA